MSRKLLFNSAWKFIKMPLNTTLDEVNQVDGWEAVDLPHDWLIYNTNDLYESSDGWYSKDFYVDSTKDSVKHIYFEGVYMNSVVYVNNQKVGEWKYGYSSFEFDITNYLIEGNNNIKVQVIHESPNTRWYSGAGIYRNVYMITTARTYLVTDGIYIVNEKTEDGFQTTIETEVESVKDLEENIIIRQSIIDANNDLVKVSDVTKTISKDRAIITHQMKVEDVELWSLESPYLYTLKTELLKDGRILDVIEQRFGYRTIKYDADRGFFLNDKHVKIYGVCEHHDLGALGAAFNKVAMKRKFLTLRKMGVNAIRTSHNMPAKDLMELADELGFLVNSEAFDMWEMKKTEYDYGRFFKEWYKIDVASWIRRDRNHPSVIMWSIGNEIPDTHHSDRGLEITKNLKEEVLLHDPKKNAHVTIGSNYMPWENSQECANELLLAGYNYAENLYEEHHKKYPHWFIYGSETSSTIQSRGVYHFPADIMTATHDDKQCSSLGNCCTSWGAKTTQDVIVKDRDATFSMGQFLWTGFDYIGEPTPYTTKNSYFGQIDTAGFPKDSFYFYQAEWTDYKTNPMIHILPYWDFNEGQLIDVRVYSNAPKVELFYNEESQGTFEIDHLNGTTLYGAWQLPYKEGSIKAVAYDEEGKVIATKENHSFTDATEIVLSADKYSILADGLDLAFVEISMIDKDGYSVENANNRVEVSVKGAGRLIGLDNGDSSDYDSYKGTSRRLFNGKLLAIIASKEEEGQVEITVSSYGLENKTIYMDAIACVKIEGVSAHTENERTEAITEVPIRKISLSNPSGTHFNKDNLEKCIQATLYPSNATYSDLEWKIVTPSGIESNLANIRPSKDNREVIIKALGDGDFRLRCSCYNGGDVPKVISELEFSISGIGAATINPYEFVAAGLYNSSNEIVDSGKEGGIVTNHAETIIGFSGVDFGEYGSDEVTLPIYYLNGEEASFEIWEGNPADENSKLVLNGTYRAKPRWDTFISNTFHLPYRLKGIKTIYFVFRNRLNFKGFMFKHYNKGTSKLFATDNSKIYGDSFNICAPSINSIGNNVSIEFDHMDFGEGINKLILCGRSNAASNSIHIKFEGEESGRVSKEMIEIASTSVSETREFKLNAIKGMQKVTFIFLPGSNFDLDWFRFE